MPKQTRYIYFVVIHKPGVGHSNMEMETNIPITRFSHIQAMENTIKGDWSRAVIIWYQLLREEKVSSGEVSIKES